MPRIPKITGDRCPACFGPVVDCKCRSCGVAFGHAKNARHIPDRTRTIAHQDAESVGRSGRDPRVTFDDAGIREDGED